MKTRFNKLCSMRENVKTMFADLLAWFGEPSKEYTVNSFLKVFSEFYSAFSHEMKELDRKKKQLLEIKRQKELQEKLLQAAEQHVMDQYQSETQGKNSKTVSQHYKSLRPNPLRMSMQPNPMEQRFEMDRTITPQNLGVPKNRLSYISNESDFRNSSFDNFSFSQEESDFDNYDYDYDSINE